MINVTLEKFSINNFWNKTPNPLKYVLIFSILIATSYFVFSKKLDNNHIKDLENMKIGIVATYELIDNFEDFRREQDDYNQEVITYLHNLHKLVEELNISTNRKFDMILRSSNNNADDIIEKIVLLNESFIKLSDIYQSNIEIPNLNDNKVKNSYDAKIKANVIKSINDTTEK